MAFFSSCRQKCPTLIGVCDHSSGDGHQVHFLKGDVMYLINSEGDNLLVVHKDTGMKGFVPRMSVTELLSKKRYN